MEFIYVPLNNTIVIDNIVYKCVESWSCNMCDYIHKCISGNKTQLLCSRIKRPDGKSVIFIKVKDMETKNFKPFDLEAAKSYKPVCTRDGREARIICFDRIGKHPIIALVKNGESEDAYFYHNNGKDNKEDREKDYDLVMKPEIKSGWININKNNGFYETEEDAKKNQPNDDFVAVKVEFEV